MAGCLNLIMPGQVKAQTFTTLHSFTHGSDGAFPYAGLLLSGNTLYGTTLGLGEGSNYGTVFAVNTNGTGFMTLYTFTNGTDGNGPYGDLILAGNTLYGTAHGGGSSNAGTVFALNINGTGFGTLYSFTGGNDGALPFAGLVLAGNTLYGTADEGGSAGYGTVFALNTNGTGFATLYAFTNGGDGAYPSGELILAGNTLYGAAQFGGTSNSGTVFSVNTDGTGFTTLHSFAAESDGYEPSTQLVLSGNTLYGTAAEGGSADAGTVFSLNVNGTGFATLYNFTGESEGSDPFISGLIMSGNALYGTAKLGGSSGNGAVFALNSDGTGFTNLYSFTDGDDGATPYAGLVLSGGTLYGTADQGGLSSVGTVFSLSLGANGSQSGSLQVTLSPSGAVSNGAQWQVDAGVFQNSGATVSNLPVGSHTIQFLAITNWSTPSSQVVTVANGVTTEATGVYVTEIGSLEVVLGPAGAVAAGAAWEVDGGPWQTNGAVVSGLSAANSHLVIFSNVPNWSAPDPQTVSVTSGATNIVIGTYTTPAGSLLVSITPTNAIGAGAAWQFTGGSSYLASGVVVTNLTPGATNISFKPIAGWRTPSNQTVVITNKLTTMVSGFYKFNTKGSPTLTITSPTKSQRASNELFTITGTAKDKVALATVYYQLNGSAWTPANSANSWTNWSASVTLKPGANTLSAYAVDISDTASPTSTVSFQFIPSATLIVLTNGDGSFTPKDNGALLAIGTNYTLTASGAKNWIFSNWVASGGENFISNNPVLKFKMQSNLVLQANFYTNYFAFAQGTYNGLFAPTNAAREQTNSGAFTFTVKSNGVLSGKLTIGTNTPALSGQFSPSGLAIITTPRKGSSTLTTTLQINFANQSVQGTVGDDSFLASLDGDQQVFSSSHPAASYEGQYTLIIPGTSDPTVGPLGTSYQTLTVSAAGVITFSGSLADGTAITPMTSAISKNGYWPFYIPLYGGSGSIWSWNYFPGGAVTSTNVSWVNESDTAKNALYNAGFTNQAASIIGSAYKPTTKPSLALTSGLVTLEGGNLPFTIANPFILTPQDVVVLTNAADTNKLTLKINTTTGVINGSFANPSNPKTTITVSGVLLQNQKSAQGYFMGTSESGTLLLDNP